MLKLDWRKFEILNEKYTDAFQTLCLHLFARFVHTNVIPADFNQAGIETEPIKYKGKWYGFQSKYFDNGMDYKQIDKSVRKAIDRYPDLDVIQIFYNCPAVLSASSTKKALEVYAKSKHVKLEWIGPESFEVMLNNARNLDLCQLFFGMGRELEYFADTIDLKKKAFLKSTGYLELGTSCGESSFQNAVELVEHLMNDSSISIIKGLPGTGKSVLLEKIFTIISGVNEKFYKQIQILTERKCIPILIKLKYCATTSLEQLIREKKWEYKINAENYKLVYLLDGLDEVSPEVAEKIISYVQDLVKQKSTKKVIISIRKASQNNIFLQGLVDLDSIYEIEDLDKRKIRDYFERKGNKDKERILKSIEDNNPHLLAEIRDILLLSLLYDTVDGVNDTTNLYDLFELKEKHLKKNAKIDQLDLLEPKDRRIREINKAISYQMHIRKEVVIPQLTFMNCIFDLFPKIGYQGANQIADYMLNNYFENKIDDAFYSYQHRRYQEYFYMLYLYDQYKKNITQLRKEEIFTNCEFFEDFFLPFLLKSTEKEKNIVQLAEVNLFTTYLGKNVAWGADNAWYQYSEDFCYAVASQPDKIFYQMIEDTSMAIKGNVVIDYESIVNVVKYMAAQRIGICPDPVEEIIRFALKSIVIFWRSGKEGFVDTLLESLNKGIEFINREYPNQIDKISNALYEEKYAEYFIFLVVQRKPLFDVLEHINKSEPRQCATSRISKYDKALNYFFGISLQYFFDEFLEIMSSFTDDNIEHFCCFIIGVENLHYLYNERLKSMLILRLKGIEQETIGVLMLKSLWGVDISEVGRETIDKEFERLAKERWIDLFSFQKEHDRAAFLSLLMKKNCVIDKYAHDSRVIYQNLYCNYARVLEGSLSYGKMMTKFLRDQVNMYSNVYENATFYVTQIWAHFIKNSKLGFTEVQNIIATLAHSENSKIHWGLLFKMLKKEEVNISDKLLKRFMSQVMECYTSSKSIDISENIEKYFSIAYLHSNVDTGVSVRYIQKGLNYGVLRHGWRKDGIVDTYLIEALEIMWNKDYLEWEVLRKYTEKYFDMVMVINRITDERYRCGTLARLIDILIHNDFSLAQDMIQKIVQHHLQTNEMIFQYVEHLIAMGYELEFVLEQLHLLDFEFNTQQSEVMRAELMLALYFSEWYSENEKVELKTLIIEYLEGGWITSEEKWEAKYYDLYLRFCQIEGRTVSEIYEMREQTGSDPYQENELKFCKKLVKCKSSRYLQKLYDELVDYKNHIVLKHGSSWKMLIDKMQEIDGNANRLIDYFVHCKFPNETFYTANSAYLYMPLGDYIARYGVSEQLWNHFKNNGGYADFINLIKAYDYIKDKDMCSKLFVRFFDFCELLVFDEIE